MLPKSNNSKSVKTPPKMRCQLNSEEKRLDFWVEKVDLLR